MRNHGHDPGHRQLADHTQPLTNNPFTILLSQARTLTGNIAGISYAGMGACAFATVALVAIIVVTSAARVLLRATAGVSR